MCALHPCIHRIELQVCAPRAGSPPRNRHGLTSLRPPDLRLRAHSVCVPSVAAVVTLRVRDRWFVRVERTPCGLYLSGKLFCARDA